jgi:8-oxo-dGTP diphosphatase
MLRRLTQVEVPTAGTHISRSKVVLFRQAAGGEGEEEVFLFRRRAKGVWKIPGGHVEMKELADEAAVREVREETGYACRVSRQVSS